MNESNYQVPSLLLIAAAIFLSGCQRFANDKVGDAVESATVIHESARLPELGADDLTSYVDPVAGFSGRVPVGWSQVVLSKPHEDGYAVSFESPASNPEDVFADYLMVEFLEGASPEGFLATPADREEVTIDGRSAYRERILLDDFDVGGDTIDLVVYQLTWLEIGYSLGLYAVGEQREQERLEQVFNAFVQSFVFPFTSMQVSQL